MTFLPLYSILDGFGVAGLGFPLVLVVLTAIMLFVKLLSKVLGGKSEKEKKEKAVAEVKAPAPVQTAQPEAVAAQEPAKAEDFLPYTPGYVTLDGVSEQDAAVIMAITSDKTGIPLERLCFKSIKRLNQEPELINIKEQDAAVIMAIVANKTGISLDNLIFNSIKLVED